MHDCEHILNIEKQWTPVQDEMLILKRKPTNVADRNAVAVFREAQMVGHAPFNIAPSISLFSRRDIKQAFAKVGLERKLNRGAGYGLEIPCMELLVDSLNSTCTCIGPTSRLNVKNLLTTTYCLLSESLTWKFSCLHVHLQSHVLIVLNFMGVVSWVSVI